MVKLHKEEEAARKQILEQKKHNAKNFRAESLFEQINGVQKDEQDELMQSMFEKTTGPGNRRMGKLITEEFKQKHTDILDSIKKALTYMEPSNNINDSDEETSEDENDSMEIDSDIEY